MSTWHKEINFHIRLLGGEGGAEGPELPAGDGEVGRGAAAERQTVTGAGLHGADRAPQVRAQGVSPEERQDRQKGKYIAYLFTMLML